MATLATLLEVVVQADVSNAQAGLMGLNTAIGQAGSNALGQASHFTRLGFLMTGMGLQAGLAARAIGAFLVGGIKDMHNYEAAARKTWTQVSDSGTQAFETIKRIGLDVARTIPVPLETVQEGLYDIFSSMNVTIKESETIITAFAKAAVAGATDIAHVSDASIAIMNAWGRGADEVTKVLDEQFATVKLGRIEYAELASTIGRAIPSARNAGASFSDLGGMIAFMTRNGLSAAQAATSAGRAFDLMTNPKFRERMQALGVSVVDAEGKFRPMVDIVDDLRGKFSNLDGAQQTMEMLKLGGSEVTSELQKLGIEVKNVDGSMKPLSQVSDEINDKFKTMSESEVADTLKELGKGAGGTIQAMRFFNMAIRDTDGDLRKFTEAIEKSSGDMEEARQKMMGSKMAIQLLKNQFQIIRMEIVAGLAPALMALADVLGKVVDWFMNLSKSTKEAIGQALAITAAVLGVVGVLLTMAGAINMTAGAFTLLGVNAAIARRMALLLYGSLGLLPVAIFLIIQHWDKLEPYFKRFVDLIQPMIDAVEKFVSTVKKKWDELTKVFREEGWKEGLKALPKFFEDVLKAFKEINIKQFAGDLTDKFNEWVKSVDWGKVGATLGSLLGKAFGTLAGMGTEIAEGLLKVMAEIDWFSVGTRAAAFVGAFILGAIQGVFSSGILGDIGGMIVRNLGPIVETALVLALAPPGLVGKLTRALAKIPIVGTMLAFFTNALRTVGLGLVGAARFLLLPLTTAISTGIRSMGATLALKMMFIGDAIMGGLKTAFAAVASRVGPLLAPIGPAIAAGLRAAAAVARAAIALIFSPLGLLIGAAIVAGFLLWKYNDEIVAFFEPIEADIKKKFLKLKDKAGDLAKEVLDKIKESWNESFEINIDIANKLKEKFDEAKEAASTKLDELKTTITTKFDEIKTTITNWFMNLSVVESIMGIWQEIQTAWDEGFLFFLGYLLGLGPKLLLTIQGMFLGIGEFIAGKLVEIQNQFYEWGAQLLVAISLALENVRIAVAAKWEEMKADAQQKMSELVEGVSTWFSQLPGRIEQFLAQARQTTLTNFSDMVNTARTKASEILSNVSNFFSQLPGRITQFLAQARQTTLSNFSDMLNTARTKASEILSNVSTFFSQIPGRITQFMATARQNTLSAFSDMVNTARTKGSELVTGFMSFLSGLPGKVYSLILSIGDSVVRAGSTLWSKGWAAGKKIYDGFMSAITGSPKTKMEYFMIDSWARMNQDIASFGNKAHVTAGQAAKDITAGFTPKIKANLGVVSGTGAFSGVLGTSSREITQTQTPSQAAPLIGQVNITSATPEQAYIDFDRKIVALNMRVGRT